MPTFSKCNDEARDLLDEVMAEYHPDLVEAEVRISLLYAYAKPNAQGDTTGPALKLHGQPALAIVKINSVKDRVEGKADATISLCGDSWDDHSEETKRAILDHECEHLCLIRDESGGVESDDAGRPRLKMREHDIVIGGFQAIVDRHKQHAVESMAYLEATKVFTQKAFPWG